MNHWANNTCLYNIFKLPSNFSKAIPELSQREFYVNGKKYVTNGKKYATSFDQICEK